MFAHGLLARSGLAGPDWISMPPLLSDDKHQGFWHPKPLSTPGTLPLVATLMGIYSMSDIVAGYGPLDLTAFPSGLRGRVRDALRGLHLGDELADMRIRFRDNL